MNLVELQMFALAGVCLGGSFVSLVVRWGSLVLVLGSLYCLVVQVRKQQFVGASSKSKRS